MEGEKKTVGGYEIIEELGKGGMGVVYKARDTKKGKVVALKVLPPELAIDPLFITRFRREADSVRELDHPHIVKLIEFGQEGNTYFIAMEYVDGGNLQDIIHKEGRIEVKRALEIILEVCDALSYAHEKGIIHRDIKPTNIMLSKKGEVKLTDFGVARMMGKTQVTTTGTIIGTPEYMSPEQTEGRHVDKRADVYSLGIVLYEMLTGKVPFKGDTVMEVLRKQKFSLPESARLINPDIPSRVDAIISEMLEKDTSRRFPSAEAVRQAIKSYLEAPLTKEREAVGRPQSPYVSPETLRGVKGTRVVWVLVACCILVLTGIVLWRIAAERKAGSGDSSLTGKYQLQLMGFRAHDFSAEIQERMKSGKIEAGNSEGKDLMSLAEQARRYFNGGNLAYLNGRYQTAIDNYSKSLNRVKTSSAFNNLGNVYMKLDRFDEAIECYRKSLSLGPLNLFYVYNNLGLGYIEKGDFAKAEEAFVEYLRHDPENLTIKKYLRFIQEKRGD